MTKYVVMATWNCVPHLTDKDKAELLASIPPFERDARSQGIPMLGSGAIYPVNVADITVEPFKIPGFWPRVYGLDVGWNRTAAVWAAIDTDADIVYLYSTYYRSQAEPSIHADAIKTRGKWIPGVIDPSSRGRGANDGIRLIEQYDNYGLTLFPADNSVEAGLLAVWQRLSNGSLKVFSSCGEWFDEFRLYRRDEKGKIVKRDDHLMDASRYLIMSGLNVASTEPRDPSWYDKEVGDNTRNPLTGY